jgi:hypothetical protein
VQFSSTVGRADRPTICSHLCRGPRR